MFSYFCRGCLGPAIGGILYDVNKYSVWVVNNKPYWDLAGGFIIYQLQVVLNLLKYPQEEFGLQNLNFETLYMGV